MKKFLFSAIAVLSLVVSGCGGGGGGGNPTASLLGPDGTEVTSLDVSTPVAAKMTGLSANTQYRIQTLDPSGNLVCDSNVYTDNTGAIPDSPYCYLRDRDTARFVPDGRVDAMIVDNDEIDGVFSYGKAVTTGDYTLQVVDSSGKVVITKSADGMHDIPLAKAFPVTSTAARTCASNAAGLCARSFLKTASNVYATIEEGSGVAEGTVVDIYAVSDRCSLGFPEGTSLADVTGGADLGVTVNYTGGIFTTAAPIWANPNSIGTFDLVIDVDRSGTYTAGDLVEIMDFTPTDPNNPGGLCGVGFTVQDAYSAGTPVITQIAMDKNRAYRDFFSKGMGDDIYAQLQSQARLIHKFGVKKWVVQHKDTWNEGDVLVDVIPPTLDEVQTGCTNQQRRLVAPINLMSPGCYDIVFDVNGDGVYNVGGDAVDNIDLGGANTCGFIVVDDSLPVTIDSIKDTTDAEVKDGTSTAVSSKMIITGTASGFADGSIVKAYAVRGSQYGGEISGTVASGAYTLTDVPMLSGTNRVFVFVVENQGAASARYGATQATVIWNPGGAAGIDILAIVTWLDSTDMDTHFIKTGGVYTDRSPGTGNLTDCTWDNCTQAANEAINWTTAAGTQTTSSDTSTGAIARMDLDCIGCPAKTETVWIQDASGVIPKEGNFLLCVVAYSGNDRPSMQVNINGIGQLPLTAPANIDSSTGNDMWFAGYVSQDAGGNLIWHAVNEVGVGADVCKQP
jgi:hypothetical protein